MRYIKQEMLLTSTDESNSGIGVETFENKVYVRLGEIRIDDREDVFKCPV